MCARLPVSLLLRRALALALTLAMASAPAAARAEPAPPPAPAAPGSPTTAAREEARQHVRRGNALFRIGQLKEALVHYERAYALNPSPKTIFNMAQCHRLLKNHERAIFLYTSFLNSTQDR